MDKDASQHLENLIYLDLLEERGVELKISKRGEQFESYSAVSKQMSSVLLKWYNLAILDLTTCSNFRSDPGWIAKQFGISVEEVKEALRLLVDLGLLEKTKGSFKKTTLKIRFPASESMMNFIRKYHMEMIGRAAKTLERTSKEDFERRLITGITVAANPMQFAKARKRLNEALHEVADLLAEGECTEVYQINAQLFPLTQTLED